MVISNSGTTCVIAIVEKDKLTVANVGHSRGVLGAYRGAESSSRDHGVPSVNPNIKAESVSNDHRNPPPRRPGKQDDCTLERILDCKKTKKSNPNINATPDVFTVDFNEKKPKFLILASKSVWDQWSSDSQAVGIVDSELNGFARHKFGATELQRRTKDDAAVVVVVFKDEHYEAPSA